MRTARTLLRALFVGTVAVGLVAPAAMARADPSPASLQQQINQKNSDLEKIDEQYNKVTEQLQANQAAAADLQKKLQPLEASMDEAYAGVAGLAVAAYKGRAMGTASALLESGSPQALLDQLGTLNQIGRQHSQAIGRYKQAKAAVDTQKAQLDTLLATEASQQQTLTSQKAQYQSELKNLNAMLAKSQTTNTPTSTANTKGTAPYVPGKAGTAVKYAYGALGKPYEFASAGPSSYDCSGLTMAAWAAAGVHLSHNAAEQWGEVSHISRGSLQAGDLVFYNSLGHVAIYVGNNQVIHAPHTGTVVQLASVDMETPYGYGRPNA